MNRIFLLTAKPRMGKTTALKTMISMIGLDQCGGFYTEEFCDDTNRLGFHCVTLNGERREIANVNSESTIRIGRYGMNIDNFEKIAITAAYEALAHKKVTVIDEIGPMQMLSLPFQQMIHELFFSRTNIVLGTISYDSYPGIDELKLCPGMVTYSLSEENRDSLPEIVCNELAASLH